jgi:hypothetical protein
VADGEEQVPEAIQEILAVVVVLQAAVVAQQLRAVPQLKDQVAA